MTSVGTPGLPWSVRKVYVAITGGARMCYELGQSTTGNLLERRDERNRIALEAFTALRFPEMTAALQAYLESLRGVPGATLDQPPMLAALGELVAFVRRFGPLGIGWGMTMPVENPVDRKSTRLNSSHIQKSRMPSSA